MSNRARIRFKVYKKENRVRVYRRFYLPEKRYTSFNIFTRDGENLTVTSEKPMTLEEAQYHYHALSISAN